MIFGELLRQTIEKNNLSVSELSRKTGIVRTLLYAVMNGSRRLTPENSGKLLNPHVFLIDDVRTLYESWLASELSAQELGVWRVLLSGLRGEIEDCIRSAALPAAAAELRVNAVLRGRDDVLGAIAAVLQEKTSLLVSNFPFDEAVSPIVYRAAAEKKIDSVVHTIRLEGTEPARKLEYLFSALAFAQIGVETKLDNRSGGAWDCYILTDEYFIEYKNDLSQAVVLPSADAPDGLSERYDSSEEFVCVFSDVFDSVVKNEMETPASRRRDLFAVTDVVSECFVSSDGVLRSISPAVPEKERLVVAHGLRNHYEIIFGRDFYGDSPTSTLHSAIPDTEIADFVKNGRIMDAPEWFFPNVPYDVREEILAPFVQRANARISVIYSEYFGRMRTNIEGNNDNLTLVGVTGGDITAPGAFKDIRVLCRDPELSATVLKLFRYFTDSYYCMEKSVGDTFIEQQLIKLRALAAENGQT